MEYHKLDTYTDKKLPLSPCPECGSSRHVEYVSKQECKDCGYYVNYWTGERRNTE